MKNILLRVKRKRKSRGIEAALSVILVEMLDKR
jgi:hypothetical protein